MSSNDQDEYNVNNNLYKLIHRLTEWPPDNPPSLMELRSLRREFYLNPQQRDELEILVEKRIRRAKEELEAESFDQAIAAMVRCAQLQPRDVHPKIELARIYIHRHHNKQPGKNDHHTIMRLIKCAKELNARDPELRRFIREYRQINNVLNNSRRRWIYLILLMVFIIVISIFFLQRPQWLLRRFPGSQGTAMSDVHQKTPRLESGQSRSISIQSSQIASDTFQTEFIRTEIGNHNGSLYLNLAGRLESFSHGLGAVEWLIQGRNSRGEILFTMPWQARTEKDALLMQGESQAVSTFRWLSEDGRNISRIEIHTLDTQVFPEKFPENMSPVNVYWNTNRPRGAELKAQVRNQRILEGVDTQLMLIDIILENSGVNNLNHLSFSVDLNQDIQSQPIAAVNRQIGVPMKQGERRVFALSIPLVFDAQVANGELSLSIVESDL